MTASNAAVVSWDCSKIGTGSKKTLRNSMRSKGNDQVRETASNRSYRYTVYFEPQTDGSFAVVFPAFPEIVTFGRTLDEARAMARDALALVQARDHSARVAPASRLNFGAHLRLAPRETSHYLLSPLPSARRAREAEVSEAFPKGRANQKRVSRVACAGKPGYRACPRPRQSARAQAAPRPPTPRRGA